MRCIPLTFLQKAQTNLHTLLPVGMHVCAKCFGSEVNMKGLRKSKESTDSGGEKKIIIHSHLLAAMRLYCIGRLTYCAIEGTALFFGPG